MGVDGLLNIFDEDPPHRCTRPGRLVFDGAAAPNLCNLPRVLPAETGKFAAPRVAASKAF